MILEVFYCFVVFFGFSFPRAWTTELELTKIWLSHLYTKLCLTQNRINSRTIALCRIPSWRKIEPYLVQPHIVLHFQILTVSPHGGFKCTLHFQHKFFCTASSHKYRIRPQNITCRLLLQFLWHLPAGQSLFCSLPTLSREIMSVTTQSVTLE